MLECGLLNVFCKAASKVPIVLQNMTNHSVTFETMAWDCPLRSGTSLSHQWSISVMLLTLKVFTPIPISGSPTNRDELERSRGFAGYYRRFVEGYSKIARPLNPLKAGWMELSLELCDDQHFAVNQNDVERAFHRTNVNKSHRPPQIICGQLLRTCAK